MTCPNCSREVPDAEFCANCGHPLRGERTKRGFSAAPNESLHVPRIVSTLFPHLPEQDMASFRIALVGGLVVVVALAILRLFPLALVAAAVLVPLITVLYVIDVDVYEDEPLRVIAFTAAWGVVGGLLVGVLTRAIAPAGGTGSRTLVQAVVLPAISVAVMLGGPLVLLPYRKFNDVLDGATFGATAAVTFAGAVVLANAFSLFSAGFRPLGQIGSWVALVLTLGVARPVLFAGLIGSAAGALWLRYRAPARDRRALGLMGNPVVAVALALAGAIVAALIQIKLPVWVGLVLLAVLAAASMVWLRVVIHVGLREEASEEGLGEEMVCANCHRPTPAANFCTRCGMSMLALPKARPGGTT
ncbi:MAG TPA: hypothetical protein DIU14_09990 [Actinobacteria bacterium]|jgi:hypothetical protein|nr:hypothetical protein [Actinomycetota bacterium]